MDKSTVTTGVIAKSIISELLTHWPETAVLFNKYKMACVGCVVAPFYTVEDAITIYGLQRDEFLADLMVQIRRLCND